MAHSLSAGVKRWAVFGAALLLAAAAGFPAAQSWRADRWMSSSRFQDWEKAAQIEPGNADYWDRLGRFRQLDLATNDFSQAIEFFRRATQQDPHQTDYWLDLAMAYENAGEPAQAGEAFHKAKAAYPLSAEVAWRQGNYLLRQGRTAEALDEMRRGVAGDTALVPLAASRALRATGDIQRVLTDVVPATREAHLSALDAFVAEGAPDPALAVWERLVRLDQPLDLRLANPLVDELSAAGRLGEAQMVWKEALIASGAFPKGTANIPLVTNGGFEGDITNGGFDWHTYPAMGVRYDYDSTIAHSGARSLRITFEGLSNLAFTQVSQNVPVDPQRRYRLSAYLHAESITTESGIRLLVFHPGGPGTPDVFSPDLVGTQPWRLNEVEFTTGPATRMVEIHLGRLPSVKLDSKIRGIAWVDDVTLELIEKKPPGAKP